MRFFLTEWGHRRVAGTSSACLGPLILLPPSETVAGGGGRGRKKLRSPPFQEVGNFPPILLKKWPFTPGPVNPPLRENTREHSTGREMRALDGFERDGSEEKQPTIGKGGKQTEKERLEMC